MSDTKSEGIPGTQRRSNYRARVPADTKLGVSVWKIGEHDSLMKTPLSVFLISERAKDVSEKGMGIFLRPPGPQTSDLDTVNRVRVQLQYGDQIAVVEGRVRVHVHAPKLTDNWPEHAGLMFEFDLNSKNDRQSMAALTRIIGQVRREEAKARQSDAA